VVDPSYDHLLRKVRDERGLDLSGYKESFVRRRLQSRFRVLGIEGLDQYCVILGKRPEEYLKLLDVLAINVTEFFRDPSLWELLSKKLIPELCRMREHTPAKVLRFLSAGSASGEEAYSIAIALCETLGDQLPKYSITIRGIDFDQDCIAKIKAGVYAPDRLKNVPPEILAKYFTREGNLYRVKPDIKKMVRAVNADLISEKLPRYFDVIFCRNVLIYFTKESHSEIFAKLHESLATGGFLILGRTETLIGVNNKALYDTYDTRERIYRRKDPHSIVRSPSAGT
jgi:chemotaxis protein methyltransferase CheR